MARALPTLLVRRWVPPPPGISPTLMSGRAKVDCCEAYTMSQAMAISRPPPRHSPSTAAISGFLIDMTSCQNSSSRAR